MRSASATCASSASAGWQQVKISRRRSSGIAASEPAARGVALRLERVLELGADRLEAARAPQHVDRLVARGRRRARRAGSRACPSRGQRSSATANALLHRLLGDVEVADAGGSRSRGRGRTPRGRSARSRCDRSGDSAGRPDRSYATAVTASRDRGTGSRAPRAGPSARAGSASRSRAPRPRSSARTRL